VLIYSLKPPAEVAIFGLRGSDIKDIRPEADEKTPISPEEFGFKGPTSDGICKYCQLMLHPEVPDLIEHHANTQDLLISSQTCPVCKRIETSLSYDRSPFQEGNSDKSKPSEPITVGLQKQPRYTRAIGSVGSRRLYTNLGIPLTITTWSRLGKIPFLLIEKSSHMGNRRSCCSTLLETQQGLA
jgi:hypothetical protein